MQSLRKFLNLIIVGLLLGVVIASPISLSEIDWDIDQDNSISEAEKLMIKQDLLTKLSSEEENDCGCAKILFPIICDNLGNRHNNVCQFLCSKKTNKDLKPKRILLVTPLTESKDYCKDY